MKAAVWHGRRDIRVDVVPLPPAPPAGWVKIKVAWCGICGSDMHEFLDGPVFIPVAAPHPLTGLQGDCILGHEFSGAIAEIGAGVSGFTVGERVTADACQHCGECYCCKHGMYNICEKLAFTGLMNNGAFADYVNVPAELVYKLPASVSMQAAAVIEPLAVGMHAVKKAGQLVGDTVVVLGAGPIGLCAIMCARAAGASRVICVGTRAARKAKAAEVGADVVIDPRETDAVAEVRKLTNGIGGDVCIECVGQKDTPKLALDLVRNGGRVVMTGVFPEASSLNFLEVVATEKTIIGALGYAGEFADVIAMLSDGRLKAEPLISREIPLADIVRGGFEELERNKAQNVKILVHPGE